MSEKTETGKKIGVAGGGAWGTALACVVARGHSEPIPIYVHEPQTAENINQRRENVDFLPGQTLPDNLQATNEMRVLAGCDCVLMVAPAQFARNAIAELAEILPTHAMLVLCAKGVERGSLKFMSQLAGEYLPESRLAVLSGPSFAKDVAAGLPTAVTLAAADPARGAELCQMLERPGFRPYLSDDILGAEIGGAVKNVLAIACGIVAGKKLGESARAALTSRGFAEMQRLGLTIGAKAETLAGLSGLGDLVLTCASATSRNFSLGQALGEGGRAEDILSQRLSVSEGATSAEAVCALAARAQVDMPICAAVDDILAGRHDVDTAIQNLMARPLARE
ncbi:MAG: NAD(P)H-dependent glycerol-3-phosphate dehydrogenase [Pseudomonadota bacterium]|nr:NAD(P)H-dependent glycerol-3-phosphate dehydrogenase [Pseudomonadota bacterium]